MENMGDVVRLRFGDKEFILVGTSHVDPASVALVKKIIAEERPNVVALEWDKNRYEKAMDADSWKKMDIVKIIKDHRLAVLGFTLVYKWVQNKYAKENDTESGLEFPEGVYSAEAVGAKVELIDRDIQVTFKRFWRMLGFKEKIMFPVHFGSVLDDVSESDTVDEQMELILQSENMDYMFELMKEKFPKVYQVIIEERNEYLASKMATIDANKTVVVLGKAHIPGIVEIFSEKTFVDPTKLEEIPPKKLSSKILDFTLPALLVVLLALSFTNGASAGGEQILRWFLLNGGLAAIGTLLVLGHPLTAIAAFITAPIGTLSPVLSVGFFAALIQAFLRKPRVSDFETMDSDFGKLKPMFRNRVLHIIIIFFASTVGGAIGNVVGGLDIIRNLF